MMTELGLQSFFVARMTSCPAPGLGSSNTSNVADLSTKPFLSGTVATLTQVFGFGLKWTNSLNDAGVASATCRLPDVVTLAVFPFDPMMPTLPAATAAAGTISTPAARPIATQAAPGKFRILDIAPLR